MTLRAPRGGAAVLQPRRAASGISSARSGVVASAWVFAERSSRMVLAVTMRGRGNPLAERSVRVRAGRWTKIRVRRSVEVRAHSRLSVSVRVPRLGPRGRAHVDDVSLRTLDAMAGGIGSATGSWLSGASGDGVVDGSFDAWRGSPVEISGTWNDSYDVQEHQWTLQQGFDYGAWARDLDVAVGGIYKDRGESWAAAAAGAYDARWRTTLSTLRDAWAGRPGTLYIRFAHEFNGDWYPWSVSAAETTAFKATWRRFRALQTEIIPAAKLVLCPTAESSASLGLDWRDAYPGAGMVDVLATDFYNQWPFVNDRASFLANLDTKDTFGAPRGLEAHLEFARSRGLPFAVPEWASNATMGDADVFMRQFQRWVSQHAGVGPGHVLYEILFNVSSFRNAQFAVFPRTRQSQAAAAYRSAW